MKHFFSLLFILMSILIFSQQKHIVVAKETIYSLTKKYNITETQLKKLNPFLNERGLQPGDELLISNKKITPKITDNQTNILNSQTKIIKKENGFIFIEIGAKETIYNLTKKYKITEEILKKHNPFLNDKLLNIGDIIKIPSQTKTEIIKTPEEPDKPDKPDKTTIVSQNDNYIILKVGKEETLKNLCSYYGISKRKIKRKNSFLKKRDLKEGDIVRIPLSKKMRKKLEQEKNRIIESKIISKNNDYIFIEVGTNETLKKLAYQYQITIDQLKKINPELKNTPLLPGFTIKIPQRKKLVDKYKDDTISIVYFLPFELKNKLNTGGRIASTNFLAGSKLALDSLSYQGKKIKINIYDSADEIKFDSLLVDINFSKTDLIIGPFKQFLLEKIAQKLQPLAIPIVSPFVNNENLSKYPNFIFPNTQDDLLIDALAYEINKINKNKIVYLVGLPKDNEILLKMKKKLSEFNFTDIKIINNTKDLIIPQNIMTEKYQNIIPVLISEDLHLSNDFINRLNELDPNYYIPFALNYQKSYESKESKEIFYKTGFTYTYIEKIDTNKVNVAKTLNLFKKIYCENPDKYAVLGFDITYDLASRMNNSGNIKDLISPQQQLSTQYQYIKKLNNTFENNGVRLEKIKKQEPKPILN